MSFGIRAFKLQTKNNSGHFSHRALGFFSRNAADESHKQNWNVEQDDKNLCEFSNSSFCCLQSYDDMLINPQCSPETIFRMNKWVHEVQCQKQRPEIIFENRPSPNPNSVSVFGKDDNLNCFIQ